MSPTSGTAVADLSAVPPFPSARRLLVCGGIALVLAGMLFGDIFAVFLLHQNADRLNQRLLSATQAVAAGDTSAVHEHFRAAGALLENRGTKVDTHVHVTQFGYLALLLALLQPYVALTERRRRQLALVLLFGSVLLPVSVFLIPTIGLAYSPLPGLGGASLLADFGGLLVILACLGELAGLWRYLEGKRPDSPEEELARDWGWANRVLLTGGTVLVLAGFLHGAYYAVVDLSWHETEEVRLLQVTVDEAAGKNLEAASLSLSAYGALQGEKAVKIAAHAHLIEFGFLAMLLAFLQQYVFLSECWKRRWVVVLLAGSVILPVFVLLEVYWGLVAGGIADLGGLLVIIALTGMLVGVVRYTGKVDAGGQ
ncbi:MAG: hypothetical protein ACE5G6_07510 [Terriglobia bacterium]